MVPVTRAPINWGAIVIDEFSFFSNLRGGCGSQAALFDRHFGIRRVLKNKDDSYCLARSIVIERARADYHASQNSPQMLAIYERMKADQKFQKEEAEKLMRDAGVSLGQANYGLADLQLIADRLVNYEICLYHRNHGRQLYAIAEDGRFNRDAEKLINIAHREDHFEPFKVC